MKEREERQGSEGGNRRAEAKVVISSGVCGVAGMKE